MNKKSTIILLIRKYLLVLLVSENCSNKPLKRGNVVSGKNN